MARTQEQRKADTRARLLAAAAELFAERGVDAVSLNDIADAADRTTGAVYAHFPGGKADLLNALVEGWQDQAAIQMLARFTVATTTADRLEDLWSTFVAQTAGEEGARWLLLEHELWLRAAREAATAGPLSERYRDIRAAMAYAFREWADEAGTDPVADPDGMAGLVLALLIGLDMQRRIDPVAVTDEMVRAAFTALFGTHAARTTKEPT